MADELSNLQQLLEKLDSAAGDQGQVTIGEMMEAVGTRSFGPLLLLAGIILTSPLSGIPGMPTTMSIFVLLIALQLLIHKEHFWLPQWLLRRSIASQKLHKATHAVRRPARVIDRWTGPRLTFLSGEAGVHIIALFCVLVAMGTPAMEVVPFSATAAGAAMATFGLSLIARDGLLSLIAMGTSGAVIGFVLYKIFW